MEMSSQGDKWAELLREYSSPSKREFTARAIAKTRNNAAVTKIGGGGGGEEGEEQERFLSAECSNVKSINWSTCR